MMAYAYVTGNGPPGRRSVRELVQRISSSRALPQLTGPRQVGGSVEHPRHPERSTVASPRARYLQPQQQTVEGELRTRFPSMFRPESAMPQDPERGRGCRARYTPYSYPAPRRSRPLPRCESPKLFMRNVFLIDAGESKVPRSPCRQYLHDNGCVVDFFEFNSSWSEEKVVEELEHAFENILPVGVPSPRFEFMKPCFGKLVVPNVPADHKWNGQKVKVITPQGHDLYIRSLQPLHLEDEGIPIPPPLAPVDLTDDPRPLTPVDLTDDPRPLTPVDLTNDEPGPSSRPTVQEGVQQLQDMFPDRSPDVLQDLVAEHGVEYSVSCLLRETENQNVQQSSTAQILPQQIATSSSLCALQSPGSSSYSSCSDVLLPDAPLQSILLTHSFNIFDNETQLHISVDKENLWSRAVAFYKGMKRNPKRFKRQLVVEFEGEEGVDAGALRSTFFELLIREMDKNLFEGNATRRIPKKDWGLSSVFEIGGMILAHSVLNGGPGFPCLLPAIYHCILTGNVDDSSLPVEMMPSVDDLPQSLAYSDLLDFVEKLSMSTTPQQVDNLIEKEGSVAIINSSKWPSTKAITNLTKHSFLQNLLVEEVIRKRDDNILSFRRGLDMLDFVSVVQRFPKQCRELFIYEETFLTAAKLQYLITTRRPEEKKQRQAYDFFFTYLEDRQYSYGSTTEATLPNILNFITGQSSLPPLGLPEPIQIQFLSDRELRDDLLPTAECCFNILRLPICHNQQSKFYEAIDKAVLYSLGYYGLA